MQVDVTWNVYSSVTDMSPTTWVGNFESFSAAELAIMRMAPGTYALVEVQSMTVLAPGTIPGPPGAPAAA